MTDLDRAIAGAREALTKLREHDGGTRYNDDDDDAGERACCLVASWKPHDSDCPHAVAVAEFYNLLAALDAAQGEAVAWQVTVVGNTGTHDYAKWAGLQAPPAAVAEGVQRHPMYVGMRNRLTSELVRRFELAGNEFARAKAEALVSEYQSALAAALAAKGAE